ncbi:MAG: hypothetical protein Q4F54_04815 [Coriobacteriia bacterium]|nr:hypothetical protein [Coriobacteriia bacterium]
MEGVDDWSYDGKELTKDVISAKFGTLSEDVTFIAHFVTPVAKYTESNSTMIFSCDDYADEDDNFIFPVNNTHWDDNFDGTSETLGLLTLPS